MHKNVPTTKSGTCHCTPLQAPRLSKKMILTDLYKNEEPTTDLGVFSTKSGHPTPCFLIHSSNFQKYWPLQNGESGMNKYLSKITTNKNPFCGGNSYSIFLDCITI